MLFGKDQSATQKVFDFDEQPSGSYNKKGVCYIMPQATAYYEALDRDYTVVMHFDEDWEIKIKNEELVDETVDKFYSEGFMKHLNISGAVTPKGQVKEDEKKKKELMVSLQKHLATLFVKNKAKKQDTNGKPLETNGTA